ncbi:hypothetical protein KY336_00770 [Candidatus Woesearchaeota archaeon]|nr:hypothetical protein [Candidatus Woesearchaeota archaeon]
MLLFDPEEWEEQICRPGMMFDREDFTAVEQVLHDAWHVDDENEFGFKSETGSEKKLTSRQRLLYDGLEKFWRSSPRPNCYIMYKAWEVRERLKLLSALFKEKRRNQQETIFCARDRIEHCGNVRARNEVKRTDLEMLLHLLYWKRKSDGFARAKQDYNESDFVLRILRGDESFMESMDSSLNHLIRTYIRQKEKKDLFKLTGIESIGSEKELLLDKARADRDFHFKNYWSLLPFYTKCILADPVLYSKITGFIYNKKLNHHQKEFSDWKSRLRSDTISSTNADVMPRLGSLIIATESYNFPVNMVADSDISCTLGPHGSNEKVAILNELDPHIGILRLIPAEDTEATQRVPVADPTLQDIGQSGISYIIQCRKDDELVWLVDGVDVGVLVEAIKGYDWRSIFYVGIVLSAINSGTLDLNKKPSKIYFNQHVKNRYNEKFNEFIRRKGPRKEVLLEKVGGADILREHGIRPEHYIEAFHYKAGTVWSEDCKGLVDAVEIEV